MDLAPRTSRTRPSIVPWRTRCAASTLDGLRARVDRDGQTGSVLPYLIWPRISPLPHAAVCRFKYALPALREVTKAAKFAGAPDAAE